MDNRAGEWRPIETAPRDGTEVLAFARVDTEPLVRVAWLNHGRWDDGTGLSLRPTHWVPLPDPPNNHQK